jgi:hypothetical protein
MQFTAFLNHNFLKTQFSNNLFSAIWIKITLLKITNPKGHGMAHFCSNGSSKFLCQDKTSGILGYSFDVYQNGVSRKHGLIKHQNSGHFFVVQFCVLVHSYGLCKKLFA